MACIGLYRSSEANTVTAGESNESFPLFISALQNSVTQTAPTDAQVKPEGNTTKGITQEEFSSKLDIFLQCQVLIFVLLVLFK